MQFKQFLGAALAVAVARAQEEDAGSANLTSVLGSNDELSSLVSLLGSNPSVAEALASAQNITLFAPNNDALSALNSSGAAAMQEGYLAALLNYHVLVGVFSSDNITETPSFPQTLLNDTMFANVTGGQAVEVRVEDDDVLVISGLRDNVTVTEADIEFSGGIIHIIDGLLTIPPNVSTTAQEAGLSAFLGALNTTELTEAVTTTPDVTIFAPNNAAFEDISSVLSNASTEDIASILQYHVINGTVAYSSTLANGSVPTLTGENITISIVDGDVFVNRARVITPDILIANGVLHVIDSVLNVDDPSPANSTDSESDSDSDEPVIAFPGATSGDLAFTSNVPSPTSMNDALTVTTETILVPSNTGMIGDNDAGNPEATMSAEDTEDAAAMPTGAIGAAALFGGAAILANL